jgi:drug/metabolite transporter (DMT)-like permease
MESKVSKRLTLIAFVVATILAGNNAVAVRFSNVELPPFFGAAVRFAAAALLLFLAVLALRLPLPTGRSLLGVLVLGILQFGASYALLYWSLVEVQAGLVAVVLALVPLMTFAFAIAHRQEAFQWRVLVGSVLAVGGVALVFSHQLNDSVPLPSLLAVVLASACFAEAGVLFKTLPKAHPITTNAMAMATGAAALFVMSWLWRETPNMPTLPATWIAILYLVLFGSIVTFVLILYVLSRWPASTASYQLVLMPLVTVPFAAWLAHEQVTVDFLVGGMLALTGVCVGAVIPADLMDRLLRPQRSGHKLITPE